MDLPCGSFGSVDEALRLKKLDLNGLWPDGAPDMYTIASVARPKLRHDATLFVSGAGREPEIRAYLSELFAVLGWHSRISFFV